MTGSGKEDHVLALREETTLARHESRAELVKALEEEFRAPGGKEKAMRAILEAARSLAPIFSVTSVKDPAADFREDHEVSTILDTAIVVEILCSAGSWLAHARSMPKTELMEKFEGWARDNGYE
ncbi:MAG TPA: hypothetical protein VGB13_13470 [Candidatus Krumholzibacteria bacterium]